MDKLKSDDRIDLERILQGISDAFVSLDKEWQYRFVNDQALYLMQKERKDLIGRTLWKVFPDIIGTLFDIEYHKVMELGQPSCFETYYPSYDMWLEVRAYPYHDGICIFYTDVTEKKKAHEIVENSEKWFRSIADNSPVMIWGAGTDTFRNYFNRTWLEFTGRTIEQESGEGWTEDIFTEDRDRVCNLYSDNLTRRVVFQTEYRLRAKTGQYRWVRDVGNPIYSPDQSFMGYTGTCTDIDEQVRVYQELENRVQERTQELTASLSREKQLNDMKSHFVSIASHEFRTPLSTILSSAGLMEQYQALNKPENMYKHIDRIKGSVKHLINILNDFLSLDKLEQGQVRVELDHFNLEQFINEILEELNPLLKRDQQIVAAYDGAKEVNTDRKVVHNTLFNLLSNAMKYSNDNVTLNVTVTGSAINISVTDKGIGIPIEDQEKLFGKYFRAGNVGVIKGTGLGLSIVLRYVELLGGNISFTSEVDKGTTFDVHIPNVDAHQ